MSETLFKVQKRIQGVDWARIMLQGKLENCPNHLKLLWLSKRSGVISLSGYLCINRGNFLHWLLTPVNITISRTCIFILFKYFRSHFKSNLLEWFWVSGWNFLLRPSFTIMHFCPHRFSPSHHSSMLKRKLSFQNFFTNSFTSSNRHSVRQFERSWVEKTLCHSQVKKPCCW